MGNCTTKTHLKNFYFQMKHPSNGYYWTTICILLNKTVGFCTVEMKLKQVLRQIEISWSLIKDAFSTVEMRSYDNDSQTTTTKSLYRHKLKFWKHEIMQIFINETINSKAHWIRILNHEVCSSVSEQMLITLIINSELWSTFELFKLPS